MIKKINIRTPIWSSKSVGINTSSLSNEDQVDVTITYKDKSDNFVYPGTFRMRVEDINIYPLQNVWGHVWVHIIPISILQNHNIE